MLVHTLSHRIAARLAGYVGLQEKTAVLTYGLELIIGESLKFGLLIGLSAFFGLLTPTLLFLLTAVPFRVISGGGHSSTYFRCAVLTIGLYLVLSLAAYQIHPLLENKYALISLLITVLISLLAIRLWVPAANPNRTFTEQEKTKFKRLSRVFIFIWLLGSLLVYILLPGPSFKLFLASSGLGILWQIFLISPSGYLFFTLTEKVFDFFQFQRR